MDPEILRQLDLNEVKNVRKDHDWVFEMGGNRLLLRPLRRDDFRQGNLYRYTVYWNFLMKDLFAFTNAKNFNACVAIFSSHEFFSHEILSFLVFSGAN